MAAPRIRLVATLVLAAIAACGGSKEPTEQPSPQPHSRYPYTEADVRFMTDMIGHHAQALEMAAMAPRNGASPEVLRLAERITAGQKDEIASMERWLRDREKPVPEPHAMHGHLMPGMLTGAQMQEREQAKGPECERASTTH